MRWTIVVLLSALRSAQSDSYPYSWTIGDVRLTCDLGNPGWKLAGRSCFFAFRTRNQTWNAANQMCRNYVFGHSHGAWTKNWLLARSLSKILPAGVYWTGYRSSQSSDRLEVGWEYMDTSIFNPTWASDQPSADGILDKCVALDLRSERTIGWRLVNCAEPLPALCETFACMDDEFRCTDNSRCIPRSAVLDEIVDCGDGSDEKTRNLALLGRKTANNNYHTMSSSRCQNLVLNAPKGTITSPNYPRNYSQWTFCQWDIHAEPGHILVFKVKDLDLSTDGSLTLEGSGAGDNLSLTNGSYPTSYVINSNMVRVRFVGGGEGDGRGFLLHYFSKAPSEVCRSATDGFTYESWRENTDCTYTLQSGAADAYTVLEVNPIFMSNRTTVTVTFDGMAYPLTNLRAMEILVIPYNTVQVQVRNAWLSEQYTAVSVTSRVLGAEPLELTLSIGSFSIKWFESRSDDHSTRSLTLDLRGGQDTKFRPHTLAIDGVQTKSDAVTAIIDGKVIRLPPSRNIRIPNLSHDVFLLMSKRSPSFQLSGQFSVDCPAPSLPFNVQMVPGSQWHLGGVVQFTCAAPGIMVNGPSSAVCLVGGQWSVEPPICLESEAVLCPLPVVQSGYVVDVVSSCRENIYCEGAQLSYGCDFGKLPGVKTTSTCVNGTWTPPPRCADALCNAPEPDYRNASLVNSTSLEPLAHALYRPPQWSLPEQPFRVCALNEAGQSYDWLDYNFKFQAPFCRSYPIPYGSFDQPFYSDGEMARVNCLDGFVVSGLPTCIGGEWSTLACSCKEPPIPPDACRNGQVVKLQPGYSCECNPGYEVVKQGGKYTCEDINECALGFDLCDPDATCVNLDGGYTCKCPHGKEIYKNQKGVNGSSLIRGISCIWKTCSMDSSFLQQTWIPVWRRRYRHDEVAQFLCEVKPKLYAEFEGRCVLGYWDVHDPPCDRKCSRDLHNPDLVSGTGQAFLLQHMKASCVDKKKFMIGSDEMVCGRNGTWFSEPLCRYLHCPIIDSMLSPLLEAEYSDPTDKARVGTWIEFQCKRGSLRGHKTIACVPDGSFSARWSNAPPECEEATGDLDGVRPIPSRVINREVTISGPPYAWTHSEDWNRFNGTWIGTTSPTTTSFLISPAIRLKSDSLRMVVHIQRLTGYLTISIYTGLTPRVPSLDEFVEVARTSRPGFVEIALDGLSDYLTVSIVHSGSVILQSVKLFYKQCDAATFDGMQLSSSFSFSKPRPVPVLCRCPTPVLQTYVTAVCHPTTGWALQTLNPCCTQAQTTPVCTYDDCANGECRIEDGKKICDCRDGFHFVDNECVPASCSHTFCAASGGGTCLESGGGGTCHCSTDFTKSRFCELQNDWICPTCEPHHKCLMIIASRADAAQRECVCAYEGRLGDCPPDPCRAHNCGSHGECVPDNHTDLGYSCRCEPGWVGEECRSPITCISTEDVYLCENGGTCDTNSTSPTCHCLTRFTGPTCNHTVDLCAGVQCLNGGSCLPTETGHFCYCASRFTGPYCEVETDLCAEQNPCQQGNCLQETGHLRCNCSAGWSGEFCDVQLDLCQVSDPCVHGNCRGELPGFQFCDCNLDYRGNTCSENVTYCDFRPCFNNGTCVEQFSSGYSCRCGEGFTGANCETVIDLCADWPCENGGTCVVADHRPVCHCAPGFSGEHCQTDISNPCDDVICMNGGTCYVHDSQAFCQCFADFTGLRCESRVDLCTSFTCENGGTCKIRDHSAKCDCIVGYGGVHCEKELTECEDFPEPLPCLNGGTCRVTADHRQYCECSINFYGTNCEVFGRSCAVINCNNGTCFNDTMLEGHCICPPDRTGEFCETVKSTSFNLYFNGQPSTQTIVSRDFPSTFLKEFTLCAWVFYAPLQPSDGSSLGRFLQLNTTTGAPILSMDNTGLTINDSFHIDVKISVMAWHHVCVRSPRFQDSDHPMWSVFLDGTFAANVSYAELAVSADLRCRIQIGDAGGPRRFRGEISLVHLYTAYLEDADIAKMAFQCRDWVATENPHLLLQWTDFTTVQRNNPGVMALYPGLCDVSDCLPGRSSCNTKDKIPPTVKSCPRNIRKLSSDRLTRVDWDTDEMFTDNVGVAAVKSNYRSGQSFTWGYYTVVYVASDAAGNTATCSFSVVVSPADCQTPTADSQLQGEVTFTSVNGTDATKTARVSCDDPFYPRNGPDFYICDVMGQWDRSIFWPANRTYIFSSCGATRDPAQTINGTLEDYGNCSSIRQSLFDSLENDLRRSNCTGEISIDSSCPNNVTNYVKRHTERDAYYTFHFSVKVNTTRSLLKDAIDSSLGAAFPNASRSLFDYVVCDGKFPHLTMTHGNASCADCPAGQYWSEINYTCAYCPKDTYRTKTDPLGGCTACPVNKTTSEQIGQKTSAACHDICSAGQFYNDFTRKCQLCPRGTYQERRGAAACVPCSLDATTTIEGAKNATDCFNPCGPGEELVADEANCVPCARGTYWVNGSFTGCQVCPQGLTTFDTGCKDIRDCEVVTCPAGTHVNINRTDPINPLSTAFDMLCIKCEMGTYQDENNQTSCKPCTPTSNCDLVNECSPLLPDTCAEGNTCKLIDTGIYSCSTVIIQPAPERSKWIIWVVAPLVAVIIVAALGFTIWICRNSLYLPGCCRKRDLKNMESTDYYRDRPRPVPRRRVSSTDYRNYPPRHSVPVRPIETISRAATVAPPRLSLEDPTRIRLRERHLPPPIITSKAELDLLEEQARARRTLVSNVLPVSSRSLGSQIVTGYSNESPGPSISAQLAPPRHRTFSGGQQPYLCDLPEDPSSSYSLHWSETTPGDSNDVYGDDDDDEDYFG